MEFEGYIRHYHQVLVPTLTTIVIIITPYSSIEQATAEIATQEPVDRLRVVGAHHPAEVVVQL